MNKLNKYESSKNDYLQIGGTGNCIIESSNIYYNGNNYYYCGIEYIKQRMPPEYVQVGCDGIKVLTDNKEVYVCGISILYLTKELTVIDSEGNIKLTIQKNILDKIPDYKKNLVYNIMVYRLILYI